KTKSKEHSSYDREHAADINVLIRMCGIVKIDFMMSFEMSLAMAVARSFFTDQPEMEKAEEYIAEAAAEAANIIIGNSISLFDDLADLVSIEPPVVCQGDISGFRQSGTQQRVDVINTDCGEMRINISAIDKN
ncbi:chemotaxis protein CheX, partial [candidate division KSB1 bacterium]